MDNLTTSASSRSETRLSDIVYEKIVGMISDGRFPLNERLPSEQSLASMLGASRPVVREALERLRNDDLIVSQKVLAPMFASGLIPLFCNKYLSVRLPTFNASSNSGLASKLLPQNWRHATGSLQTGRESNRRSQRWNSAWSGVISARRRTLPCMTLSPEPATTSFTSRFAPGSSPILQSDNP